MHELSLLNCLTLQLKQYELKNILQLKVTEIPTDCVILSNGSCLFVLYFFFKIIFLFCKPFLFSFYFKTQSANLLYGVNRH